MHVMGLRVWDVRLKENYGKIRGSAENRFGDGVEAFELGAQVLPSAV